MESAGATKGGQVVSVSNGSGRTPAKRGLGCL